MLLHRRHVGPFLDEHDPIWVFRIEMAIVNQTTWLRAGAARMFDTKCQGGITVFGAKLDRPSNYDHPGNIPFRFERPSLRH